MKSLYGGIKWRRLAKLCLQRDRLCQHCLINGVITEAKVADHINPVKTESDLLCGLDNLQGLCKSCHSKKQPVTVY